MNVFYLTGTIAVTFLTWWLHVRLMRIGRAIQASKYRGDSNMVWVYILAAMAAIFLLVYLIIALTHAEKF